jgi:tetratricopeptide (TPR) repeat protein
MDNPGPSMENASAARPLDHRTFDRIQVEAFKQPLVPDFRGGPVLPDPAFAALRHKKADLPCDRFDENASFNRYIEGEWVYLGAKYPHFGHVMAEMVHRIVPSKMFFPGAGKHLILTAVDDDSSGGYEDLSRTYREVLDFCETDPRSVLVLNENAIIERLSICEEGSSLEGHPSPWYLSVLRDFSTRRLDQIHGSSSHGAKVWVSRSRISHGGTILGERYVEKLLADEGFFVFYPEEATLSMQMDVYRKASELVFPEGSACHGTELLGETMLGRTFLLVRRIEGREDFGAILRPRSKEFEMFLDTFFLGSIVVDRQTRRAHNEFAVSVLDVDRFVVFCRDHQLARLDSMDVREYFETAEEDLKAYFSHHMRFGIADVDAWRIGDVRLEFEKQRRRFVESHQGVATGRPIRATMPEDINQIEEQAWNAHKSGKWLEAVQRWEIYREHFPYSGQGFTLASVALIELGRFYEADALLLLAMEKFPDFAEAQADYAFVAHRQRDWREAVARWEAFRAKFPSVMMGYSLGGTALCELGRYADADNVIRLGLERLPDDEELLEKYAWTAQLAGARTEARRRWRTLRKKYPDNHAAAAHGEDLVS